MSAIRLENLSSFGRLAVKLDTDFAELTRLSGQLQRLDIDSDSGFEHAVKILNQFAQHGSSISEGIQEFSKCLQEARERSEVAAKAVSERAELIRGRKDKQDQMRAQLELVGDNVRAVNASLAGFRKEGRTEFSGEEKRQLKSELERLNVDLRKYLGDAQAIKEAARQSKFKSVERDAQDLIDVLRSSCRKVDKVIAQ